MQARKDVMVYVHDPKKKLFHVVAEIRNNSNALAEVLSALGRKGILVLSGFTNMENGGQHRVWSFFAESKNLNLIARDVKDLIDSSPHTISSVVNEGTNGFLVDRFHFPLTLNIGQRVVVIGQNRLSNIFRRLKEGLGEKAAEVVYEEGLALGKNGAQIFTQVMPPELIKENFKEILMIYSASGWGKPELANIDVEKGRMLVRMAESFECSGQRSEKPYSHFIKGHICGLISGLSGTAMKCDEIKCVAAGDQYCEFSLSRA